MITAPALRVGTFNVRWDAPDDQHRWDQRRARFVQLLRDWAPDLLGLQEPLYHQLEQLAEALPHYTALGVGRDDGKAAGEFCPVLYRTARFDRKDSGTFWLSDTPNVPGSTGWGNRIPRICTWACLRDCETGAELSLYNVHLDHESQPAREKSVLLIMDTLRQRTSKGPVIVMGDFNVEPGDAALRPLQAKGSPALVSALGAMHPSPPGTFHEFTGHASGGPIDHIFLSPDWHILEASVLTGDGSRPFPSDHFPVAATVRLKREPQTMPPGAVAP